MQRRGSTRTIGTAYNVLVDRKASVKVKKWTNDANNGGGMNRCGLIAMQ